MIAVDRVTKRFGARAALDGVSVSVASGERIALVGPNGSGKTTLLRCLLGMVAYEGTIRISGCDPHAEHAITQRHVAYVPQRAPALTAPVGEVITFWAALREQPRSALVDAARGLGLSADIVLDKRFADLSGGQQQKLLAAMALATTCPVLLLDEPTANLDPTARAAFFAALGERRDVTVLLSSHRLDELAGMVDRVVVLDEGRVAFDDRLDRFLAQPDLARAAGIADNNVVTFRRRP